jgi:DNA-binding XRE family transcriptional regulator
MTFDSDDSRCSASRGFRLREFRLKLNLTQKELADVCGVSRTSVVHWERDRYPVSKSVFVLVFLASICQELSDDLASWPIKLLVWTDRERDWWKKFLTTGDSLYGDFAPLRQLLDVLAPPAPDLLKRYKRQARYERQRDRL